MNLYLHEIDLFYVWADLITLKWFNKSILQVTSYGTIVFMSIYDYPPASKASRVVANLTEKIFNTKKLSSVHHSQGGMKFATQISPLLILFKC